MQIKVQQCLCLLLLFLNKILCLKVLGIFPFPGKSHNLMYQPYLNEMAKRGHEVTIMSHFPHSNTANIKHINLSNGTVIEDIIPLDASSMSFIKTIAFLFIYGIMSCENLLNEHAVHDFIRNNEKFDVVVTEMFNSDCSLGIAHKLNAPVVGMLSGTLLPHVNDRIGIPRNPAFFPFHFGNGGSRPNFYQRIECFFKNIYVDIYYYIYKRKEQKMLAEYYPDIPPLDQLAINTKFLLINHYFTLRGSMLNPSNFIEVAGIHVPEPKPLPKDLQQFIEEAEHGVIYVCFGSLIKTSTLAKEKRDIFLSAFKELPQRIIWKWEEDELPGKPKNIMTKKWLPQNDILAHPNVKAFFSHGGMMGTIEAVTHGVPVVTMPIIGDQPSNAAFLRERGIGITVYFNEITKEKIINALNTVMTDKFKKLALGQSEMFRNRPVSPMDTAIFWTEFAAKHPNVSFTAPSATVPLYQYYLLDIFGTFAAIFFIPYFIVKYLLCRNRKTNNARIRNKSKTKKAE